MTQDLSDLVRTVLTSPGVDAVLLVPVTASGDPPTPITVVNRPDGKITPAILLASLRAVAHVLADQASVAAAIADQAAQTLQDLQQAVTKG